MRRIVLLVTVAAVMLTMSVAPAFAGVAPECQNTKAVIKSGGEAPCVAPKEKSKDLPKTGGVSVATVAPLAAILLLGTGVVTLAVIRRR